MNIAVTAGGPTLESPVFEDFAGTPFLLVVDMDTLACTALPHAAQHGSDLALARAILEHRCEAVITGKLGAGAFNILADEAVTRYVGSGMSAGEALEAMERRELAFIRNASGTDECLGNETGLEDLRTCSGHHH